MMSHIIKPFCSLPVPLLLVILVLITDVLMKFSCGFFNLVLQYFSKDSALGKLKLVFLKSRCLQLQSWAWGPELSALKNSSGRQSKGSKPVSLFLSAKE